LSLCRLKFEESLRSSPCPFPIVVFRVAKVFHSASGPGREGASLPPFFPDKSVLRHAPPVFSLEVEAPTSSPFQILNPYPYTHETLWLFDGILLRSAGHAVYYWNLLFLSLSYRASCIPPQTLFSPFSLNQQRFFPLTINCTPLGDNLLTFPRPFIRNRLASAFPSSVPEGLHFPLPYLLGEVTLS